MSAPGNGQSRSFVVRMSAETRGIIRRLHAEAVQLGNRQRFLSAFREIVRRLSRDPLIFGEPLYRLPAIRLLVPQGGVLPLMVVYGVHEDQPLVLIRDFKALS
jgi:hypothetical protein